jgi:hypothetical protein
MPEIGATLPDMQKTAVENAVRDTLELTLQKYPL